MFSLERTQVQSLVRELRSLRPRCAANINKYKKDHTFYLTCPARGERTPNTDLCSHGTWPRWTTANDQTGLPSRDLGKFPTQSPVCAWALRTETDLPTVTEHVPGQHRIIAKCLSTPLSSAVYVSGVLFHWMYLCLLSVHWVLTHLNAEVLFLCFGRN